jgi:hypothetical protein
VRALLVLAGCLISGAFVHAECVTVSGAATARTASSRNVRVLASANGKPIKNATVEAVVGGKDVLSVLTDDQGAAALPRLLPGYYSVVAISKNWWQAEAYVNVLDNSANEISTIRLALKPEFSPALEAASVEARRVAVTDQVRLFKGSGQDPSGTAIGSAVIWVFPKDFDRKRNALQMLTDENGRFSSNLPEGTYVVVSPFAGVRIRFAGLKITQDGDAGEHKIFSKGWRMSIAAPSTRDLTRAHA